MICFGDDCHVFSPLADQHELGTCITFLGGNDRLQAAMAKTTSSVDLFGTREFLGTDYVMRRALDAA